MCGCVGAVRAVPRAPWVARLVLRQGRGIARPVTVYPHPKSAQAARTGKPKPPAQALHRQSGRRPDVSPPTGRRPGRLPMSRCGFPPRDPAGRFRGQRLNSLCRCAVVVRLSCLRLSTTSRTRRTTACAICRDAHAGRAAQSFPVYVPRQRISEEVPQDIPQMPVRAPQDAFRHRQLRPSNPFGGYVHITVICVSCICPLDAQEPGYSERGPSVRMMREPCEELM